MTDMFSPTTTTTTTTRTLYSSGLNTPITPPSTHTAGPIVSAKQPYHRKSRSSGNLLASYNSLAQPTVTPLTSSISRTSDFSTHSPPPRVRSASNSSPSSVYGHSALTNSQNNALSRSKTPSPPRRHPSAPRSTTNNYSSYLFDAYQKKSELRYTKQ